MVLNNPMRMFVSQSGSDWIFADNPLLAPPTPTNWQTTNLGVHATRIDFSWTAAPGADAYDIWYQQATQRALSYHGSTTGTTYSVTGMATDTCHAFYVSARNGDGNSPLSPALRVKSGHPQVSIPAGSATLPYGGFQSASRWRQNQWNYGGSWYPQWGWFSTEAYRYAGFIELPTWLMRDRILAQTPQLNGYWNQIGCSQWRVRLARLTGVGDHGSPITVQWSLAEAISTGNTAEPGPVPNILDIGILPVANGVVTYTFPTNWAAAIYQQHKNYNGLLVRPYRYDGARQPYGALDGSQGMDWSIDYNWPNIVTQSEVKTSAC